MALQVDPATEYGARVMRRLNEEIVIWLSTLNPNGAPSSVPVWFLWDGESILIYSQPHAPKVRNVEQHSQVELHFNSDATGGDVIRIAGQAVIDRTAPPFNQLPAMVAKYRAAVQRLGTTPEDFAAAYSTPIRVTPGKVRGF
jgi:PPOX class probable F420-dependent enzyme